MPKSLKSPRLSSLERDILKNGVVTKSEIQNALETLGQSVTSIPKSFYHDIDTFSRRVAKLDDASKKKNKLPTAKQLRPLHILARKLTWKLAGIAWKIAKGHIVIGAVGAYGYHTRNELKGKFIMACASWMLYSQWNLAIETSKSWLKHKVQLTLWQTMIRLLSLPIDIPVWMVKKVSAGVRSTQKNVKVKFDGDEGLHQNYN